MVGVVELGGLELLGERADDHGVRSGGRGLARGSGLGILMTVGAGSGLGAGSDGLVATGAFLLLGGLLVAPHAADLGLGAVHGLGELHIAAFGASGAGMAGGAGVHGGMMAGFAIGNRRFMLLMIESCLGQGTCPCLSANRRTAHHHLRRLSIGGFVHAHTEAGQKSRRQCERQGKENHPAPSCLRKTSHHTHPSLPEVECPIGATPGPPPALCGA